MNKKQGIVRAKAGLSIEDVVRASFEVLNGQGIAKLSTRAIATELNVSMNTVMWHIGTKDRLLELMADAIVGEAALDKLRGDWRQRAAQLLGRLRGAMLRHRDGALVVAGTFPALPSTLAFGDRLVAILLAGGAESRAVAWTAWNLFYFTLGLVQEEQRAPDALPDALQDVVGESELPSLHAVLDDFLSADYDARFTFGIGQILGSLG
ncbi:TetR/AcrR family transcriptional regulator C-terminal domain-containing protein [Mycolicibacter icosiumassiliensis]|uniref:TetR/AcrR family transcriptional regulator C-terminal domain-containing protein n=1 Tax=Mycolicibacter icosiumassiliensis TaxID=1792835 RepID=UPI000836127C|nr:TetR/AcrR family transcriptional regulator C-terminal domain-containing protein [Mycolicibacter icosiumassiliensis]